MKATRKLIPALALLLVSAMMLGTASFAWFSMNKTVTATGMSIQAEVPTNLFILEKTTDLGTATDNTTASSWTNTVDLATALSSLPAAGYSASQSITNNKVDFVKLTAAGYEKVNTAGAVVDGTDKRKVDDLSPSDYVAAVANTDYIVKEVDLILNSGNSDDTATIGAKVSMTADTSKIREAVHVMLVVGGTKFDLDMGSATKNGEMYEIEQAGIIDNLATTAPTSVAIYIWYDGPDTECYNAAVDNAGALSFSIAFTATVN